MKGTAKRDAKFKSGSVIKGQNYEIIPPLKHNPGRSFIVIDMENQIPVSTGILGSIFKQFINIKMEDLAEGVYDGICKSMTGDEVEPDGWDEHGFPSILLAMGMI